MKSFASDNYAGVLPEVMEALNRANVGHDRSYGADVIAKRMRQRFSDVFGCDTDVAFVFNGTGANILSLSAATLSYNAVLCADISHIYCDESSAPETFTGCRFFPLKANEDGKLSVAAIEERLIRKGDVHFAQPAILSITQATEYGTVYTKEEISEITALCKANNLFLHMDGSRFFNAAASLKCELADISAGAGVDILSLGGTKAGMMFGEAVLVFNKGLKQHLGFKHKQVIQLASKTRFIAAQFEAMLDGELWRRTAGHANAMAQKLRAAIDGIPGVKVTKPVSANAVFAEIPREWYEPLQEHYPFYVWNEHTHEVRLMCSWDSREEEIANFAAAIKALS